MKLIIEFSEKEVSDSFIWQYYMNPKIIEKWHRESRRHRSPERNKYYQGLADEVHELEKMFLQKY